jgi:glycosyltransferase involved in cell wall biosynthesis
MSTVKVSVVIPCYNATRYLKAAVDSILNQTYTNLEILLIDDGSTDDTLVMIREIAQRDQRVLTVVNPQNLGLIRTLNKGMEIASGEFIARMDADDISYPNRIERMLQEFNDHPEIEMMSAGQDFIDTEGRTVKSLMPMASLHCSLKFNCFFNTPFMHGCVMARNYVFKQNLYDIGYLHTEDFEMFSRLAFQGIHISNINEILYKYRLNPEGISYQNEQIQREKHVEISKRNLQDYFGEQLKDHELRIIANRINFSVRADELKKGIRKFGNYYSEFLKREHPNTDELKEIRNLYDLQRIDIFIQSLKHASSAERIRMLPLLLSFAYVFRRSASRKYLLSKFTSRA